MTSRKIVKLYRLRWRIGFLLLLPLLVYALYLSWTQIQASFGVGPAFPIYSIPPAHHDDTIRIAVIGDSWAEYHATLECDTILQKVAKRLIKNPVQCFSRGHSAMMTKEIYQEMFSERTVEHAWEKDFCTQPLLERHPDYCIVMAGVNDLRKQRPPSYYIGNYQLILQVLLKNGIRPVVMEIPEVDIPFTTSHRAFYEQWAFKLLSYITGSGWGDVSIYQKAMQEMLHQTGLVDSVLFVPVSHWNPGGVFERPDLYIDDRLHLNMDGYHVIDSCMATDIINDYIKRNTK